MSVVVKKIMQGMAASIHAIGTKNDCPVLAFLGVLAEQNEREYSKIWALLERTINHGVPRNTEKCRVLKDTELFEFKTGGGVRIIAFWDAKRMIICTHGFMKKSQKTPKPEIEKAETGRKAYFTTKAAGKLVYEE
jgi:phage-related protein